MKAVAAHRHVEFVVSQNYVLNPSCQYADIVLPITTPWEKYGTLDTSNREILLWSSQVTPRYSKLGTTCGWPARSDGDWESTRSRSTRCR